MDIVGLLDVPLVPVEPILCAYSLGENEKRVCVADLCRWGNIVVDE